MSFSQFLKEKDSGFRGSAYLFHGSDPFFLKEAERIIKEGIPQDRRDFALDVFDLDPSGEKAAQVKDVLDSLNTFSFFSEKKAVVVLNVQKLKQKEVEAVAAYLADPSDSSTFFLFYNDTLRANKKASFPGCRIISLDLNQGELREWLTARAREAGISITAEVFDFMTGVLGHDAGLLTAEITKLSLLGKNRIELKDAADIISGEAGVNTFEFTKALASGDKKKTFHLGNELRNNDLSMLLGAINWQISNQKTAQSPARLLQKYRALLDADTVNKSTGSAYPLELLITKLLDRK
jgi:DNA polymerase III delta subunit